jgi:hypothetical protein
MGCACPGQSAKIYGTSIKQGKNISEVEELAELPARAKDEEMDLVTLVEISVRCSNLSAIDKFSLIDPVVYFSAEEDLGFQFKDKTEVQSKTTDPSFITTFKIAYSFEKQLRFKLDVYDNRAMPTGVPSKNAMIGTNVFTIHELVSKSTHSATKPLLNPLNKRKELGDITVRWDEAGEASSDVEMVWKVNHNRNKHSLVLKIYRQSDEQLIPVYQSESTESDGKK